MADPLSIVASVIGISETIARQIQDYRKWNTTAAKDANAPEAELLSELHNMQLVLEQLRQLESQTGFISNQGDHGKARIVANLTGCEQILKELDQRQGLGGRRLSRLKSFTHSLRQREVENLVQSLHVYQKELQLLMTIQLFQATSRMSLQLRGSTTPIDIPNSLMSPRESDEQQLHILDWLTTFDYQSRHNELSRVHAPNTGSWFLKSDAFNSWMGHPNPGSKARPSNVLWCNGVPGSGKSVMMATAIKHITESNRDPTTGVAYFYYDYKTKASSRDIISCLLKQLCTHQPKVPRAVQQLYDRYKEDEMSGSMETLKVKPGPETGELFAALFDVASEFKRTLLCIDGLDECAPEFQEGMLEVIRRLMKVPKCRLLVTSRAEETYQELFRGKLSIQIEAASEDVHAYVRFVLTTHPELRDLVDEHLEIRIAECLSERANGLFLFVYLSMQGLFEQTSVSELKNALEEMPATLDDVYNGILQRIRDQSSSKSRLAMRIFMWLSYCEQPLTIFELQHAIAVDPVLDADDIDPDRIPPARFFEDVCMDLVSIDKDRHLVLLAHASLSQYLTSLRHSLFPRGLKNLAYSILTYLHYTEFASGPCKDSAALRKRLERYPLAMYAARYWGDHVIDYWQGRVPKGIMEFLDSPLKTAAFVQIMYASSSQDFGPMREYPKNVSGLHLAAYFGIQRAVRLILQGDDDTQCAQLIDSWGRTPLHSASERCRSQRIVEELLDSGVPVDALDKNGRAAIHLAAKCGHAPIVLKLLSQGADPARLDNDGKSAFDYAAAENHPHVISELLENSPDGIFSEGNALLAAARSGHGEVVELLLERGIEHQEVDALLVAANLGFEEIVKILYVRGTNLDSRDPESDMTALHYASKAGRTSMVKLLLVNGSNVTLRDPKGRTALFFAAERGDEATLRVLTEYGAEIEARNIEGKTALFECAQKGNVAGVDFLLRRGATVSSSSSTESTSSSEVQENALQIAAYKGYEEVVGVLLEKYPDNQGSTLRSTLSYAAEGGHEEVAQLLIQSGVEVDLQDEDPEHRTALTYAVEAGKVQVAEFLISQHARVDARSARGRTPLFWAIRGGNVEAVRLLLDHGAEVNCIDNSHTSPLVYAVQKGHAPVVKLLLERGADRTVIDSEHHNASFYALTSQNRPIQEILESATSINRSATFTTHRGSSTGGIRHTAISRTSAAKDPASLFTRSQSDAGPRTQSKLYDAISPRKAKVSHSPQHLTVETPDPIQRL